jgi:hypothetical protein
MNASTTHRVITAAKASAATFVEEFGRQPLEDTSDWDSVAYGEDNCGWPDEAWPVYQSALLAEITRLQAEESEGVEVEEISSGCYEAADGTVIVTE